MRHLCDSNVLVAATVSSHPHHAKARAWIESLTGDALVLCRVVQTSFLRLITTEAVMREDVRTNAQAISILNALMSHPHGEFIREEPPGFEGLWLRFASSEKPAPKVWMDAYLAAFAVSHSLRLVTFDRGFDRYRKEGLDLLLLKG